MTLADNYVMWDLHVEWQNAIKRFKKRHGIDPEEIVIPNTIMGLPVRLSEAAKNGIYIGPAPRKDV